MHVVEKFLLENHIEYSTDVLFKDITSFKIGGPADLVVYPNSAVLTAKVVNFCRQNNIKYYTLGKCSNILVKDNGIRGVIIKTDKLNEICLNERGVFEFGAGVSMSKAANFAFENSCCGMEFAQGIPGSIGGAVYMNAGAYDGCMADIVLATEYVDDKGGIHILDNEKHDFSYRHSFFSDKPFIITKTYINLKAGEPAEIYSKMQDYKARRKEKQPLEYPSAGSVFKRPKGHYAGQLIENSGLKGCKIGGAMVSTKHCGFIINEDNASADDVIQLIDHIKKTVYNKQKVDLECEIKIMGE